MKVKKIILTMALAAVSLGAYAQQGGGFQGGPPPGGGMRMQMGGPGGGGFDMLLFRQDVQADLQLTDDQKSQLSELGGPGGRGGPGGGGGFGGPPGGGGGGFGGPPPGGGGGGFGGPPPGGGGGGFDPEQMRKQMDEMRKKRTEQIKKILTAEQYARLKGISIQLSGNAAILNPEIQTDLAFSDTQKTKIKSLQQQQMDANRALFDQMRDGDIDRDQIQAAMKKSNTVMNDELGKVLTADQKTKLKTLAGKPFKATDPERGPGGPGGGGPGFGNGQ